MDVRQAVQFVLDEINLVEDPVLRAEMLATLRETTDSGYVRERGRVVYQMRQAGYTVGEIVPLFKRDESRLSRDSITYARENGLPRPRRQPSPEAVWRANLRQDGSRLHRSDTSTPTTS